jgi:hypothetical protein
MRCEKSGRIFLSEENMSYDPQTEQAATEWLTKHRFVSDPQSLALIVKRVEELVEELGGYIAPAHFERVYLTLVNDGVIKPFRGTFETQQQSAAIPEAVIDFIEHASAFEQRRRYATDREFKKFYDLYANQQLKEKIAQESSGRTLSVEEYNRLPAAQIAKRYQSDRSFKAQVDSLISRGLI